MFAIFSTSAVDMHPKCQRILAGLVSFAALSLATTCLSSAAENRSAWQVDSPGGQVHVEIQLQPLSYSVSYHQQPVLTRSALGLEFKAQAPLQDLTMTAVARHSVDSTWTPVWGKVDKIRNHYNEIELSFAETASLHRRVGVTVRAYADGVALRYQLPAQPGLEEFILEHEQTEFRFSGEPTVWATVYPGFHNSSESEYPKKQLASMSSTALIGLPMLAQVNPNLYAAIAEADLTDWAGMFLHANGNTLSAVLSPRLDGEGLVKGHTPHASPWRVLMLGATPGELIESNIIENLNPPSAIADTSWIKPGKMAWDHWWSGDVKMDNETNRRYIAFASEMGFPYQLIDWQWYGAYNQPDAEITHPAPQLDMPGILQFAKEHHVREWIWMHSGDVGRALKGGKLDAAFATYESWGIAGVKIDFMDSDDQEMVNWYITVVKLAAAHHLMVDYHGAFKPTGLRVTWPNLVTREGVMGNEYNKFSTRVTPLHKLTIPFTRMLVGPMDYTPGGFLNRSPSEWKQTTPTQVMGSRAQELALFVVYWSPLTCVTDDPEHYHGQPGLEFLRVVPTVWDEIKVLDGSVGEHIVVARRSGRDWFVGGMTGDHAYDFHMPLSFLGEGKYVAHIYADPKDEHASYESVTETKQTVTAKDAVDLSMRLAGGVAIYFEAAPRGDQRAGVNAH